MGKLPDWIGNFPFPPDKKKPTVVTRSQTKQFIYPDKPENSDFNWNYASTDKFFIAQYQLSPVCNFCRQMCTPVMRFIMSLKER